MEFNSKVFLMGKRKKKKILTGWLDRKGRCVMAEDNVKNDTAVSLLVYGFGENYAIEELRSVLADVGGLTYLGHLEADGVVAEGQMSMSSVVQAELPIVPTQILVAVNFWLELGAKNTANDVWDDKNYVQDEYRHMNINYEIVCGFGNDEKRQAGSNVAVKRDDGIELKEADWVYVCDNRTIWLLLPVTSYVAGDVLNVGVNTTHDGLYVKDLKGAGVGGMSVDVFACGGEVI